ncbi:hypothetical protein BWD09_05410 [Neisseria dentiae]|uniref:Lipoprotein n=1 Tax=Neisseria dentiae TaxID=194197 RepID=A0A1X3DC07_9NEIS|nr:hypothetical protein [Neisseria dentiae]OSI17433.1 hypothetical protein BWD09_05410 [Neisseria dentiae]QMT45824.1 hypothetical protein H3L92_03170 [Neisseria dentiae]STZ51806.1 Uncharacterised protein [Neisseria dentiae]
MKKLLTLIGCSALLLTACNLEDGKMFDPAYDFRGLPKAESDPVVTENPQKRQKYEVTVTFKDAPGKFEIAKLVENYSARNCRYTTNRMAGATMLAHYQPEFALQKISDTVYRGEFYTDRPLNEDYYGQGVCLWEMFSIRLSFRANDNKKSTYFSESIDQEILQKLSEKGATAKLVFYHQKRNYPVATWLDDETGFVSLGISTEEAQQRNIDLKDTFRVEVEIRRI